MTSTSGPVDLRRRADSRLVVSRIAAQMFWADGVAATRGEDVAAAAGIATRTLWRYFRSKEACVEPVLEVTGRRFAAVLAAWPLSASLEEYLAASAAPGPVAYGADDVHAMRMVHLGRREPALRSSWLMVCDEAERRAVAVVARRLGLPVTSLEVSRVTAAVSGAVRALTDAQSTEFVELGRVPDGATVLADLARTVREASAGRLGDAVHDSAG